MCGDPLGTLVHRARVIAPQVVTPTAQQRFAASPPITCARCRAQVNVTYEGCPHCGASLRATTCAYCGRSIKAGLDDCPSCGAPALAHAGG